MTAKLGLNLTTNFIDGFKSLGGVERPDLFCNKKGNVFECDNCHPNQEAHNILADLLWDKMYY